MSIRHAIFTVATALALLAGGAPAALAAERAGHAQGHGVDRHLQAVGSRGQHGDRHGGHRGSGYRHWPHHHHAPRWRGGWDPWARPYYRAPLYHAPRYYGAYPWPGYAPLYYYRPRPVYPLYPAPYGPGWSFSFGWSGH